jgi:uncharacterized RDD family membrane protein YckC
MEENPINEPINEQKEDKEILPAGFNERFIAYTIDTLPFVVITYLSYYLADKYSLISASGKMLNIWKITWIAIFILYESIFTSGGRATLGKYIMGIRVKANDGSDLSFLKAFIRVIGYFISSILINMGYVLALFTKDNRALHDYISGSRVIKIKERSDFMDGVVLVVSWSLLAFLLGNWIKSTVLTLTPIEQRQIEDARKTVYKISQLEEIYFQKYGFYTDDIRQLAELTRNVQAVRKEIVKNLSENSLEIASNGKEYVIAAKAKNWRKTKVEISSLENKEENKK